MSVQAVLKKRIQNATLAWTVAMLALIAIPVAVQINSQTLLQRTRFVAMDNAHTFYISESGTWEDATEIHEALAVKAAHTILDRHPPDIKNATGYDNFKDVELLFCPPLTKKLNEEAANTGDAFRQLNEHTKFELGNCNEISVDEHTVAVVVSGIVLTTKVIPNTGDQITTSPRVILWIKIQLNDVAQELWNGKLPGVVVDYNIKYPGPPLTLPPADAVSR